MQGKNEGDCYRVRQNTRELLGEEKDWDNEATKEREGIEEN